MARTDYQLSGAANTPMNVQAKEYSEAGRRKVDVPTVPETIYKDWEAATQKYIAGQISREDALREIQKMFEEAGK